MYAGACAWNDPHPHILLTPQRRSLQACTRKDPQLTRRPAFNRTQEPGISSARKELNNSRRNATVSSDLVDS